MSHSPLTVYCLASAEKGAAFIRECKRQGCYVILLTREKYANENWPREAIDEIQLISTLDNWDEVIGAINRTAQRRPIDRVVALDDFDVETAAMVREHFRMAGMSYSTSRRFRDKLAMRVSAREHDVVVPDFVQASNHAAIHAFTERVPPPWIIKPRGEAGAIGIKKVSSVEELWHTVHQLGDKQSFHLIEQFVPGDIYHVDSIISEREVVFSVPSKYGRPPFDVAHGGGIFTTRTLDRDSGDAQTLLALNREIVQALGLVRGVTHTEFIRAHEHGRFYFLETAARVGGAHISDLVEMATGVNLWAEWAKIELLGGKEHYTLPEHGFRSAGLLISLARQEWPDTSAYSDPEVVWRLSKQYHAGLVVASDSSARVGELLDGYGRRFYEDFSITIPAPDSLR